MAKSKQSKSSLKATNDIYIIEEDSIETSYDTGVSKEVMDAVKSSKLVIPEAYKNWSEKFPCRGIVLSKGNLCKLPVKEGDRVIYARLGVQRYQFDGKNLCSVREPDIHAIIS